MRAASTEAEFEVGIRAGARAARSLDCRPDLAVRDRRQPRPVLVQPDGMVRAGVQRRRVRHAGRRPDRGHRARHAAVRAPLAAGAGRRRPADRRRPGLHRAQQARRHSADGLRRRLSDHQRDRAPGPRLGLRATAARAAAAVAGRQCARLVPGLFRAVRFRRLLGASRPAPVLAGGGRCTACITASAGSPSGATTATTSSTTCWSRWCWWSSRRSSACSRTTTC